MVAIQKIKQNNSISIGPYRKILKVLKFSGQVSKLFQCNFVHYIQSQNECTKSFKFTSNQRPYLNQFELT